jgi:Icc-related predicted phosphoesterase
MRIQLISDLHLEFAPIEIVNANGADILVLSGDILVADVFTRGENSPYFAKAAEWRTWMETVCAQYKRVYYILGNHEHYRGNFYKTFLILQEAFSQIHNLVILDNSLDFYEGYLFVGGTLWTNFDRDNFKAMLVQQGLNDYKLIEGKGYRKLVPTDTSLYHDKMINTILHACSISDNVIVLGHHAPSYQSVTAEHKNGPYSYLNPGYCSHLDPVIEGCSQIKLWTHGHVHSSHDYMIGDTRIIANPRGYARNSGTNENPDFDPNLTLDI